jgi:site-specific recombinase XerD
MRRAAAKARLRKRVTPHMLRHSFATHLLELGVDVAIIQALLGHRHIDATTRYTKISSRLLRRIRSPLDLLGTVEAEVLG